MRILPLSLLLLTFTFILTAVFLMPKQEEQVPYGPTHYGIITKISDAPLSASVKLVTPGSKLDLSAIADEFNSNGEIRVQIPTGHTAKFWTAKVKPADVTGLAPGAFQELPAGKHPLPEALYETNEQHVELRSSLKLPATGFQVLEPGNHTLEWDDATEQAALLIMENGKYYIDPDNYKVEMVAVAFKNPRQMVGEISVTEIPAGAKGIIHEREKQE